MRTPLPAALLLMALAGSQALSAQVGGTMPPIGGTPVMLPTGTPPPGPILELLDFQAETIDRSVELQWTVAAEHAVASYRVERSEDARNWQEMASLQAHGIALESLDYRHVDHPTLPGTWYYRLRSVDEQGAQRLGPVVPVWFHPRRPALLLWPNPARDDLNLALDERNEPLHYRIHDRSGNMLVEGWLEPDDRRVDVRHMPAGMHSLVLTDSRGLPMGSTLWLKE
jgi:hypothetical protein